MISFRFPRGEKLKSQKLIELLFQRGRKLTCPPLRLIYLSTPIPGKAPVQVAFAVPSKVFRRAVDRNRIKRLMRECYRLKKAGVFNNIGGDFAFLFLYIGKEMPTFKEIDRSMQALLTKFPERTNDEENIE